MSYRQIVSGMALVLLAGCGDRAGSEEPEGGVGQGGSAGNGHDPGSLMGGASTEDLDPVTPRTPAAARQFLTLDRLWPDGSTVSQSSSQVLGDDPRCSFDVQTGTYTVFAQTGETDPTAVRVELLRLPALGEQLSAGDLTDPLHLTVGFQNSQGAYSEYEYRSSVELDSYCISQLEVTGERMKGSLACRDLMRTTAHADRISATLQLDCTLEIIEPPMVDSGTGGVTGSGGSGPSGGTGGGVSGGSCSGVATSCSLLSNLECGSASGCSLEGSCSGYASSCYYQTYSYGCISQDGCVWSSYSDNCSGFAWSCDTYSGSASCVGQKGCSWSQDCEGTPFACSSFYSESTCEGQPGCYWTE